MFTKVASKDLLKSIFTEEFLNKTSKVTLVADGSVMSGNSYGVAKLAQRVLKDEAILESRMYPDVASGQALDDIAREWGIAPRFGALQSSTSVLVFGAIGTTYTPGTNTFTNVNGVIFDIITPYVIGVNGFGYVPVRSRTTGANTNVDAATITAVNPVPIGHTYCINEYQASYGADIEDDDAFRKRIKEGIGSLSKSTISQIEQVFMKINSNVLKVYYNGVDSNGRIVLSILTADGSSLNTTEINDILLRSEKFFGLTEIRPANFLGYGISLVNINWIPIDISLRADLMPSYNVDDIRRDMQVRMNKLLDYRYWKAGDKVDWTNLLDIAKNTDGVRYVNDAYFFPNADMQIDLFSLPRIRGFRLMDLNGNILSDSAGFLNPVYYPAEADFSFIATVLSTI